METARTDLALPLPAPALPLHPLPRPVPKTPDLARTLRRYLRHGTLPQLAAFETVLRLGSVTAAAEVLCMAQPTVSGHLRKLSEAIGLPLFEVRGRQLVPTEAARALHAAACEVFAALERVDGVLSGMREARSPA